MQATGEMKIKRIMLIDDNETDLFICKKVIQMYDPNKQIIAFTSAEEALHYLKTTTPDLLPDTIFLDINMPGMNGFIFLMEFENLAASVINACKIIVLSSSNSSKDIDAMKENKNVLNFITKPLSKEDLKKMHE